MKWVLFLTVLFYFLRGNGAINIPDEITLSAIIPLTAYGNDFGDPFSGSFIFSNFKVELSLLIIL